MPHVGDLDEEKLSLPWSWRVAQGGLPIRMAIGIGCERMWRQRMVGAPWSLKTKDVVCGTFRKE